MNDMERAIEMLQKASIQLAVGPTTSGTEKLRHEIHALLIDLDRTPPQYGDMMSLRKAGELLGVSPDTLRHQAQAGRFGAVLMGNTYVVTRAEVERYGKRSLGKPGRKATAAY